MTNYSQGRKTPAIKCQLPRRNLLTPFADMFCAACLRFVPCDEPAYGRTLTLHKSVRYSGGEVYIWISMTIAYLSGNALCYILSKISLILWISCWQEVFLRYAWRFTRKRLLGILLLWRFARKYTRKENKMPVWTLRFPYFRELYTCTTSNLQHWSYLIHTVQLVLLCYDFLQSSVSVWLHRITPVCRISPKP